MKIEIIAFCVITFEPIKVQTCSAPQNDRLNLSFVKDINVDGVKLARNGRKMFTQLFSEGSLLKSITLIEGFKRQFLYIEKLCGGEGVQIAGKKSVKNQKNKNFA